MPAYEHVLARSIGNISISLSHTPPKPVAWERFTLWLLAAGSCSWLLQSACDRAAYELHIVQAEKVGKLYRMPLRSALRRSMKILT